MMFRPARTFPSRLVARGVDVLPGLALTVPIAVAANLIGTAVPVLGSALPAIVIGVVVAVIRRPGARFQPGVEYSGRFLLQLAVVLLGAQLSLDAILRVGAESLPVMLSTLTVCLLGTWIIGRALRVPQRLRTLIGVGTGICGASAIAAVSPVIGALSAEVSYAVSTIFVFNILAVVLFPLLGHALGMDPHTFGLLAGTAVNDTSSVVAAASVFGAAALGYAVVVKLVRTLLIIPISIGLSVIESRRAVEGRRMTVRGVVGLVPWFLIGFLVVAVIGSLGVIPAGPREAMVQASGFLIATAMAGIGLSTDVAALRRAGWRPLLLGAILWILVTATALAVIALTGS
ncbi:putative sulfate exporter family transporter [Microbacterium sp. Au-Mic1]|uniref:YeiH family protein n=1 Tax=Microbacterium sp. Au-Mic1 TaxID=2906457 RepID=UPI001E325AC8|nr:putative sulfate exporter family transporter [Microbacterium sp. Au-Mic1]MCE4026156.1 putative sulfate exporter family transporter [Microbacterium sp. Au-Mic1]